MFGSLGIFQALVEALKTIISDLIGTTSDTYADATLMGRTKTGIKSIQRGVLACACSSSPTSTNGTISSVDVSKSMISYLGCCPDSLVTTIASIKLTNATTITGTVLANAANTINISYEVIEYY